MTEATPLDLIEARAQAATSGPWHIQKDREMDYEQGIPYAEWPQTLIGPANAYPSEWSKEHGTAHQVDEISELTFPDAVFIAAARTDVPKLVAALRAVEAVCATSEEHAAAYNDTASIYVDDVRAAIREALG